MADPKTILTADEVERIRSAYDYHPEPKKSVFLDQAPRIDVYDRPVSLWEG